jgi:hypothetical protein
MNNDNSSEDENIEYKIPRMKPHGNVSLYFIVYKFEINKYGSIWEPIKCGKIVEMLEGGYYLLAYFKSDKRQPVDYLSIVHIDAFIEKFDKSSFRFYTEERFREETNNIHF